MKHPAVRWGVCFVLLLLAVLALLAAAVAAGSVGLTLPQVSRALLAPGQNPLAEGIVRTIRMPRALSALLLGGCLAVSGYLLQTYFSNPIAGPFVLGISSGAKLAVAMAMIFVLGRGRTLSSLGMIGAAFAGALAATGFILLLSLRIRRMSQLIVGGVMVGYICSAITDFAVTFAEDSNIVNLHNWSLGSFSGTSWGSVRVMALVTLLGLAACMALAKPMNAYRAKPGGECALVPHGADFGQQPAFGLRNSLCRAHQLCGHCGAAADARFVRHRPALGAAARLLFGGQRGLPWVRSDRAHAVCPHRAERELGHGRVRRAHRALDDAAPQRSGGLMPWKNAGFLRKKCAWATAEGPFCRMWIFPFRRVRS